MSDDSLPDIAHDAMCAIVEAAIPEPCRRWFGALLAEARRNAAALPPVVTADAPVTVETANDTTTASGQSVRGRDAICLCGNPEAVHGAGWAAGGVCAHFRLDPEAGK